MKVFIDTNVLLEVYHLSGPDLEELRKLVKLVESGKVELLVTQQVVDEFWRNREGVIADALKRFRETRAQSVIPNIIRSYEDAAELKTTVDKVNAMVRDLTKRAGDDIEANALKADEILGELFKAATVSPVSDELIARAQRRCDVGNPPGKKGSLGDAINWEWLLEQESLADEDRVFVLSSDGDFESELVKGNLREFLIREWEREQSPCEVRLEKSLAEFLAREFADIKLADEVEKVVAIERLEDAGNFSNVHRAIYKLDTYDDFTDAEVGRLLSAYVGNNQVYWILHDPDVEAFARKLLALVKTEENEVIAADLWQLLDDLPF